MASERRRITLATLGNQSLPISVEELASVITERDVHGMVDDHRVIVSLHHKHLPMLDEMGVIEYDASSNEVTEYTQILDPLVR